MSKIILNNHSTKTQATLQIDKRGYYVQQIDRALEGHDSEAEHLTIKFFGSKNNSNSIKAPLELVRIIRGWYELNGQDL